MRTAFIEELVQLAAEDERIWLLCGDLGFSVLEAFADRFPKRYLNAGVSEQNMTGMAAGLALSGKIVFTYSIGNFPILRCLEQFRNDVCYHNLSVKAVSVGGGLAYGSQGYSHHAVEDLAILSTLPYITVAAPGDPLEARAITRQLAGHAGPAYLRLGKAGEPVLHQAPLTLAFGQAISIRDGDAATLISTGGMLATTLAAADELAMHGAQVTVLSMPYLVPLDEVAIHMALEKSGVVLTVEEHGAGGLGAAVGECIARYGKAAEFEPLRLNRIPVKTAGSQEQLRARHGLTSESIVLHTIQAIHRGQSRRDAPSED